MVHCGICLNLSLTQLGVDMNAISRFANDDSGMQNIEYTLIASLISLVIIASLNSYALSLNSMFSKVTSGINSK